MKYLTIIIPTKNEDGCIGFLLNEIKNLKFKKIIKEIIIVDASTDNKTLSIVKKFKCKIIKQKKNGYGDAIIQGIKKSKTLYSVVLDGDGSKNPRIIYNLYKKINKNYSFVFAERYGEKSGSDDDTFLTFIGNRMFTIICKILFGLKLNDLLHTFFICKTDDFKKIKFKYKDFSFCAEMPIVINHLKLKISYIPSRERKRIANEVKVNSLRDGYKITVTIIKLFLLKISNKLNLFYKV
jgi:dolichol-phosphate mannosyltransferase